MGQGRIEIVIPEATPSLNEILRWKANGQHREYTALRDGYCLWIRAAMNKAGIFSERVTTDCRVKVAIERHCAGGGLDDDNFRGGCKPLLDALRLEGAIRDDSPKWLTATYTACKAKRGEAFTRVTIEPELP